MFSHEKRYKIGAKVHGKGGILLTSRLACAPLLDWTAVAGFIPLNTIKDYVCTFVDCLDLISCIH